MAYLTQISTSTLSNQNIAAALLVHTYTNTTRARKIVINCHLDQIQGNGNYSIWVTKQLSGAGSAYKSRVTTEAVLSGVTALFFGSIALAIGATDVVKVYVLGLSTDTTTPDIITNVYEEFINVDASGNPTPNDSSGITTILADYARRTGDYATVAALTALQSNVTTILANYATAAGVWSYASRTLTSTASATAAAVVGSAINIQRGDYVSIALTGLGNIAARTKLYFTIKTSKDDADTAALIKVEETAGLQVLNGSSSGLTTTDASLTVTDGVTGALTIVLKGALTATLTPAPNLFYDIQIITANGALTMTESIAAITGDVTRALT